MASKSIKALEKSLEIIKDSLRESELKEEIESNIEKLSKIKNPSEQQKQILETYKRSGFKVGDGEGEEVAKVDETKPPKNKITKEELSKIIGDVVESKLKTSKVDDKTDELEIEGVHI